jgi:hypothetical protein
MTSGWCDAVTIHCPAQVRKCYYLAYKSPRLRDDLCEIRLFGLFLPERPRDGGEERYILTSLKVLLK